MQLTPGAGRFAPSPSGDLHVGNLRTAVLAWLFARSTGRAFLLRVEDLDRVRARAEQRQLADLAALGLDWDGPVERQSERGPLYLDALARLQAAGLVFECFCTRRDIAGAASAPHGSVATYPGTCRHLTDAERDDRRRQRPPALRLRAGGGPVTVHDALNGDYTGPADDVVLRRNDGAVAYNLAVVVDDAAQGIDQVVRGDDLLPSSPAQARLARLLGLPPVGYAHVPLALGRAGRRLAKRDGAVTLTDLAATGVVPATVRDVILDSLGLPAGPLTHALAAFDPGALPRAPWTVTAETFAARIS
ncbi:tRNA glutamyl-Q(34) synthetase GluQRS [Specibacter cremeus]|uniref:tRNA glutamyl-Q(34) synthetase GluQRS n=1 Tax=Specibacter cremeus TaxID=1629051 RepID=UPI000F7A2F20|nr:tRNA glutamyl-Q(34) synthetase GluQRS [Specibacter cremeus]